MGRYHDEEWGQEVRGDDALYERIVLEGFQAGLSWRTILSKREAFREAFDQFQIHLVAAYDETDVKRLLADPGIVRNERKVRAAIENARAAQGVDLTELVWRHAPAGRGRPRTPSEIPTRTPESTALAEALRGHGFRQVGPVTMYALMQAVGMVDDHLQECPTSTRRTA